MYIPTRKLLIVGAAACLAALAQGCSNNTTSDRAGLYLTRGDTAGDSGIRYYSDGRTPQPVGRMPAPGEWSARPEPRRLPVEQPRAQAPLRRYAAMPRHKPHAPHVRQNEQACLAAGYVRTTSFIRPADPVGRGACMVRNPFLVTAAAAGRVKLEPAAKLRCQMIPSFERWVTEVLQPGARAYLGSPVVSLRIAASYACRTRNSQRGARLSEHGRGNAIDISEFRLADGRTVTVKAGWRGSRDTGRFLRYVHRGACDHFSTVLGPNADRFHHDHLHFDLASHGRLGTYRVCK
jgi:hypothetical protein